jgi:hypothetical protein
MCGCAFNSKPAATAARSTLRAKPAVVNGDPRSLTKTNGDVSFPLERAQGPQFVAALGVGARGAVLDPPHMQDGAIEVDLVPAQVAGLGGAQPVPEGHEDHGRVPVTVSVGLGCLDQGLELRTVRKLESRG